MNRQNKKIKYIKDAFDQMAKTRGYEIKKFAVEDSIYFKDVRVIVNLPKGNYFTERRYQIFVGPRGGIIKARYTTFSSEFDKTKILRGRIYLECL